MFWVDIKHLHKYVKNIVYVGILYNLDGCLVDNILIRYCFVSEVEKWLTKRMSAFQDKEHLQSCNEVLKYFKKKFIF